MGAPTGCISVGHQVFVTSSMPTGGATAETCGHDAVAACCAHDACTSAPIAD
jgi:hypothetical protein